MCKIYINMQYFFQKFFIRQFGPVSKQTLALFNTPTLTIEQYIAGTAPLANNVHANHNGKLN